ncbi:Spo11/DNA topoisomerase VI subunit A [Fomitopsis serialis]|uniref:Spo11/DNA topoisomerase VI subunit A n=1 Tax=Fomitopsis serialis TaxID=139415 RepID=UPI002007D42B|nr:Spo11/DNA topoisomerase VI subunit A [Neoantrodia serialis]KAH9935384.1 Spo11/DNA topoisomerase VI subunit A [Neoantrodia serialis]
MFPRKGKGASIQPFTQLFRVVSLVHEALSTDMPLTKRDMYYKDAVVDKLVDDLAATLGVGRADLNVRASAKGLVCGSKLVIHLDGGDAIQANDSEGTLIPTGEDIAQFEVDDSLSWVLIVEKEAVFQTLCRTWAHHHGARPSPCPSSHLTSIGQGYPDVATRQLVKTLSDNLPSYIPILALVDGDAYGLDILSVYRFGSAQMQHERESLAAARVRWLGIWTSELAGLDIPKDALIPITKHDEKKALSMLRRSGLPKKWRKELQYMLHNRRKAEIEILSSVQRKATMPGFVDKTLTTHR